MIRNSVDDSSSINTFSQTDTPSNSSNSQPNTPIPNGSMFDFLIDINGVRSSSESSEPSSPQAPELFNQNIGNKSKPIDFNKLPDDGKGVPFDTPINLPNNGGQAPFAVNNNYAFLDYLNKAWSLIYNNQFSLGVGAIVTFAAKFGYFARFMVAAANTSIALVLGLGAVFASKFYDFCLDKLKNHSHAKYSDEISPFTSKEFSEYANFAFGLGKDSHKGFLPKFKSNLALTPWLYPKAYYAGKKQAEIEEEKLKPIIVPKSK